MIIMYHHDHAPQNTSEKLDDRHPDHPILVLGVVDVMGDGVGANIRNLQPVASKLWITTNIGSLLLGCFWGIWQEERKNE